LDINLVMISRYSSALKKNATTDEIQTLQLNRALAHLKMHSYEAALDDVKSMVLKDHPPEKAAYRASQAHYHLNQFQLCLHTLEKLLRHYPENEAAIREKARVQGRILEQSTGKYDFQKMCNDSKTRPLSLDNATYVGSVKVKQSEGRGQGLFTTKNVVAGELLLCEKAFAYCYEEGQEVQPDDFTKNPVLANVLTSRVMIGTQVRLMKEIIQKLKRNPSLIPSVTSLHHGSYVPVEDQVENDPFPQKVIDTYVSPSENLSMPLHGPTLIYKPWCFFAVTAATFSSACRIKTPYLCTQMPYFNV
jgi:tetratricopeptide (TPR) repeat protein